MAPDTALLRELAALEAIMKQRGMEIPKLPTATKRRVSASDLVNAHEWARRYRRIEGRPFTLDNHKPLVAIYEDEHPHLVIQKPAQVGVSELAVTRTLHALDVGAQYWRTGKAGLNVAYLFPTGKALSDFSKERFTGIMGEHEHIGDLFTGWDDVTFKQAGDSYLYLRSAWIGGKGKNRAGEQLLSFPADVLVLDEFDRMDPAAVEMARKRMRASVVKRELDISTPTLPGRGINGLYQQSDQQYWEVGCDCGAWVEMDFWRDVHASRYDAPGWHPFEDWQHWEREDIQAAAWAVLCPSCRDELDRTGDGRWVARRPHVTSLRGYHVPALAFSMVDLRELALHAISDDPTQREEFFRSDLGLPYEGGGANVTALMLDDMAQELEGGPYTNVTMGVDVGARFHYRISASAHDGTREVLAQGAVATWEQVDGLMAEYKVRRCVVDAQPELHGAQAFADRFPGKVFRAYYSDRIGQLTQVKEKEHTVTVHRTMAMDAVYARIANSEERWPARVAFDKETRSQLQAPVRVTVTDSTGQSVVQWQHTTPDHAYHAAVYDLVAQEIKPTKETKASGVVMTGKAKGWQPKAASERRRRVL